jgi:hypothetical protein
MRTFRLAARSLLKQPGMTALVVLTLALGLGANAAVFAIIDALVLRPYPAAETERLVVLAETSPTTAWRKATVSPANFLDWRRQADAFEHLAAFDWWDANLVGHDARRSRPRSGSPRSACRRCAPTCRRGWCASSPAGRPWTWTAACSPSPRPWRC